MDGLPGGGGPQGATIGGPTGGPCRGRDQPGPETLRGELASGAGALGLGLLSVLWLHRARFGMDLTGFCFVWIWTGSGLVLRFVLF